MLVRDDHAVDGRERGKVEATRRINSHAIVVHEVEPFLRPDSTNQP